MKLGFDFQEFLRVWKLRCEITENTIFRFEGLLKNRSPLEVRLLSTSAIRIRFVRDGKKLQVAALIHPEGDHRTRWDSQLASIQVIDRISHVRPSYLNKHLGYGCDPTPHQSSLHGHRVGPGHHRPLPLQY